MTSPISHFLVATLRDWENFVERLTNITFNIFGETNWALMWWNETQEYGSTQILKGWFAVINLHDSPISICSVVLPFVATDGLCRLAKKGCIYSISGQFVVFSDSIVIRGILNNFWKSYTHWTSSSLLERN